MAQPYSPVPAPPPKEKPTYLDLLQARLAKMTKADWRSLAKLVGIIIIELVLTGRYAWDSMDVAISQEGMSFLKALWSVVLIDGVLFILLQVPKLVGNGHRANIIKPLALGGAWYLFIRMLDIAHAEGGIVSDVARQAGFILLGFESLELAVDLVLRGWTAIKGGLRKSATKTVKLSPAQQRAAMRSTVVKAGYKAVLFLLSPVVMIVMGASMLVIDLLGDVVKAVISSTSDGKTTVSFGGRLESDGDNLSGSIGFRKTVERDRTKDRHLRSIFPLLSTGDEIKTTDVATRLNVTRQTASSLLNYAVDHGVVTSPTRGLYVASPDALQEFLSIDTSPN